MLQNIYTLEYIKKESVRTGESSGFGGLPAQGRFKASSAAAFLRAGSDFSFSAARARNADINRAVKADNHPDYPLVTAKPFRAYNKAKAQRLKLAGLEETAHF
ncbi:MAG: hypothetical protein LBU32_23400 [Clostridiales bacterium]|jgi:hypothetical protein|nr:hypothetical protein [Clostridiales bacterium]